VVGGDAAIVEPGREGGLPGWKRTWLVPGSEDDGTPVLYLLPFVFAALAVARAVVGVRRRGLDWLDDRRMAALTVVVSGALIWWFEGRRILRALFTGGPTGWKDDVIRWGDDLASARFGVLLVVLVLAATLVSVVLTRALWTPIANVLRRVGWSTRRRLNREPSVG
jgi:hypothetical protein